MSHLIHSEILINLTAYETRVALVENGLLQEIFVEREADKGLLGNIYKGKVTRVLPGMQAAFVDLGLEQAGFLHVSDLMPYKEEGSNTPEIDMNSKEADIRRWVYEGQELLVQVIKNSLGTKGPRLTTHLSVVSRYLVYMPDLKHIGISLRVQDVGERERLQKLIGDVLNQVLDQKNPEGYIVRTVAEGVKDQPLSEDVLFLEKLWKSIKQKAAKTKKPGLIYEDLNLKYRALRDLASEDIEKVWIDDESSCIELAKFAKDFVPRLAEKIEFYRGAAPLFEMYGVEAEIQKALQRKVLLKSGGYVVFDQTEAMTTIDVNTGHFVGAKNLEETIFKTNLEATLIIGRQLRLRNLGGIIIIDFIDMSLPEHRDQVLSALSRVLERDPAKTFITEISSLGLVQMTRKRTQGSLEQHLCEPCPQCEGRGKVKTVESMIFDLYREILREASDYKAEGYLILISEDLLVGLQGEHALLLADLESKIGVPIKIQVEANYTREEYDIILL